MSQNRSSSPNILRTQSSNDHSSVGTPPPPGSSYSGTKLQDLQTEQNSGSLTPPPGILSHSSPTVSRNGLPGKDVFSSRSAASSIRNSRSSLEPLDRTPPGQSPSSSLGVNQIRERRINSTPSPERSFSGSLIIGAQQEHDNATAPYATISPNLSGAYGNRTPPPPIHDSLARSDDLERGEKRRVQSTTSLDAAEAELEEILQLPIKDRVRKVASSNLIYKPKDAEGALVINFATLQRMRLQKLQSEIAKHALEMRYQRNSDFSWEENLQEYIQAWRDLDYMQDCATRKNDPFLVTSSRCLDAAAIKEHLTAIRSGLVPGVDQELIKRYEEDCSFPKPLDTRKPEVLGYRNTTIKETKSKNFVVRLGMATLGWVFIVGPMLLMVLHNTRLTALLTTSVCVGAFGVMMAKALEKPFDVLSATAAYAAVLMVFVGTNTATGLGNS